MTHRRVAQRLVRSTGGFSLVELLVVVSVVGIFSLIGLVVLNPIRESARINKNQRNAQSLAAVAGAAQAAGASLELSSVNTAIEQLKSGVTGYGIFASSTFRVAPFTSEEITAISPYLEIREGTLVYKK